LLRVKRGHREGGDKDGRMGRKGKKRKRLQHYRDQLLGTVSYGICHVALLVWDSVWREKQIINYTEVR